MVILCILRNSPLRPRQCEQCVYWSLSCQISIQRRLLQKRTRLKLIPDWIVLWEMLLLQHSLLQSLSRLFVSTLATTEDTDTFVFLIHWLSYHRQYDQFPNLTVISTCLIFPLQSFQPSDVSLQKTKRVSPWSFWFLMAKWSRSSCYRRNLGWVVSERLSF